LIIPSPGGKQTHARDATSGRVAHGEGLAWHRAPEIQPRAGFGASAVSAWFLDFSPGKNPERKSWGAGKHQPTIINHSGESTNGTTIGEKHQHTTINTQGRFKHQTSITGYFL